MAKRFSKTLSVVFVIFLLVLMVGVISFFTGGFTHDFKTFYITVNGEDILTESVIYAVNEPLNIDVNYAFDKVIKNQDKGYSVDIKPLKDVRFQIGNKYHSLAETTDFIEAFNVVKSENSFTFTMPKSMNDIIHAIYGEGDIKYSDEINYSQEPYFEMTVRSANSKSEITLTLQYFINADGVEIDKSEVIL